MLCAYVWGRAVRICHVLHLKRYSELTVQSYCYKQNPKMMHRSKVNKNTHTHTQTHTHTHTHTHATYTSSMSRRQLPNLAVKGGMDTLILHPLRLRCRYSGKHPNGTPTVQTIKQTCKQFSATWGGIHATLSLS